MSPGTVHISTLVPLRRLEEKRIHDSKEIETVRGHRCNLPFDHPYGISRNGRCKVHDEKTRHVVKVHH
jgi:hypothetical protein